MTAPEPADWLRAWARIQRLSDRDTVKMLNVAVKDIQAQVRLLQARSKGAIGETVRVYQLKTIEQQMLREQAKLWRSLGDMITATRLDAAAAAIQLNNAVLEDLFASAGQAALGAQLAQTMEHQLLRTLDVAVTRMTQSAITLSQRIYNMDVGLNSRIQNKINSALLRGLSAREFAAEAVDWFNPGTPGGARYAAMRLARTEINNAFHAMAVNSADQPWVKGMKWHLSGSHPKPDECDEIARRNPDNLGEGVYKVKNVPRKPHPHCFCFVTPVVMDEDEFLDDLVGGKFDSRINEILGGAPRAAPRKPSKSALQAEKEKAAAARKADTAARAAAKEEARKAAAARLAASPAGRRAAAKLHTDRVVDRDLFFASDAAKARLKSAIGDVNTQAPESMLRLRELHGTHDETWKRSGNRNTGAFYTYGRSFYPMDHNDIHFNPEWFGRDHSIINESFIESQRAGWLVKSYEDDGLKATVTHELGHHIDKMATSGTGQWPASVGRELSEELGRLVGGPGPELDIYQPGNIMPGQMVKWVSANQAALEKNVSKYAAKSPQELMAEIWCAFVSGNPATSPIIKRIGRLMQRAAEEKSKP